MSTDTNDSSSSVRTFVLKPATARRLQFNDLKAKVCKLRQYPFRTPSTPEHKGIATPSCSMVLPGLGQGCRFWNGLDLKPKLNEQKNNPELSGPKAREVWDRLSIRSHYMWCPARTKQAPETLSVDRKPC